jgi:hypothetical protein
LQSGPDVRVRLTRKLSEALNGLDLRPFHVGQVLDLADPLGLMLIAEQWGEEVIPLDRPATADDRGRLSLKPPGQTRRKPAARLMPPRRARSGPVSRKKT